MKNSFTVEYILYNLEQEEFRIVLRVIGGAETTHEIHDSLEMDEENILTSNRGRSFCTNNLILSSSLYI